MPGTIQKCSVGPAVGADGEADVYVYRVAGADCIAHTPPGPERPSHIVLVGVGGESEPRVDPVALPALDVRYPNGYLMTWVDTDGNLLYVEVEVRPPRTG